jgi:hypothetical protein
LRSQAAANNWIVPDDILALSNLSGLPPSWSPWIEATTSHYHLLNIPLASKDMSEGILRRSRTLLVLSDEAEAKADGEGKVMNVSGDTNPNGRPRCSHCKKAGHTQAACWKLHGEPDWVKAKAVILWSRSGNGRLVQGTTSEQGCGALVQGVAGAGAGAGGVQAMTEESHEGWMDNGDGIVLVRRE